MKSLREFIEYSMPLTGADDREFVLVDDRDKIQIEFSYKDENICTTISYKDIDYESGAEQWTSEIKSSTYKDIKYVVSGDYTETGRYGISTINCQVWVKRGDDVIDKITPKVAIQSFQKPILGNTYNQIL